MNDQQASTVPAPSAAHPHCRENDRDCPTASFRSTTMGEAACESGGGAATTGAANTAGNATDTAANNNL
ncbi:MAG TPA: hypothetical protein VFK28_11795 [Sphingomicrobium sp.]|jgi:hypothetical protein|nr:hypothetical protein [Sphingomicrobium sp.]